jgi:hypothetical protein
MVETFSSSEVISYYASVSENSDLPLLLEADRSLPPFLA